MTYEALWQAGGASTTANVRTVRSTTGRRRSSGGRQAMQMWKATNASHIRTASTTMAARQSQSKTKIGKLQLSLDEKSGAGQSHSTAFGARARQTSLRMTRIRF